MTTLPETEQDAPQGPLTPPPSPWSAPRPDGPLAAALRLAETQRAAGIVPSAAPLASSAPEAFEHDIEALAREAKARDDDREALAIALEWPQEGGVNAAGRRRWIGWAALGAALLLAGVAAAIAMSFAPPEELLQPPLPVPDKDGLKLEKRLSPPPAPPRHAAS